MVLNSSQIGFRSRNDAIFQAMLEKIGVAKFCRIGGVGGFDQDAEDLTAALTAELVSFIGKDGFKPSGTQAKAAKVADTGGVFGVVSDCQGILQKR